MTLFEIIVAPMTREAAKHDLGDDFVECQINCMTNVELLQAISDVLGEIEWSIPS